MCFFGEIVLVNDITTHNMTIFMYSLYVSLFIHIYIHIFPHIYLSIFIHIYPLIIIAYYSNIVIIIFHVSSELLSSSSHSYGPFSGEKAAKNHIARQSGRPRWREEIERVGEL